jgi:hypothetical protein
MLNLMVGCLPRSQEKLSPRKIGLFEGPFFKMAGFEMFLTIRKLFTHFFLERVAYFSGPT